MRVLLLMDKSFDSVTHTYFNNVTPLEQQQPSLVRTFEISDEKLHITWQ